MTLSVRYCSVCRVITQPSQTTCPGCGGASFTNAMVIDPNSQSNGIDQSPNYTNLKSALEKSELYLQAISNFLSVIWLFFVSSVVCWGAIFLATWAQAKYEICLSEAYNIQSCDKFSFATLGVRIVGGILALLVIGHAWDRGWIAFKSIRRAEKL